MLLALAKLSPIAPLRLFATGYIEVMRGIPSLAILFLIYFGLADFGLIFDAFPAAVIGFGLNGAAYMAEIFRAGILSIHGGQMEAALTVGMTPLSAMRWVILPQALRVVLPPLANFGIALLERHLGRLDHLRAGADAPSARSCLLQLPADGGLSAGGGDLSGHEPARRVSDAAA